MSPRKKNDLTEENVQATEDNQFIGGAKEGSKFPKVASKAKIKSITREIKIIKIKFDGLTFSPGQEDQLASWLEEQDELLVTLEQYQSRM